MSPVEITPAERRLTLAVVTIALGIVSLIHGLNATAQFLAVFAAAPFVPRLMRNFGPAAMMFWSVLASALVFLALPVYVDVHVWFALRLLLGIALSFLCIAGEAWVSHVAEERTRGRSVAIYGAVTAAGFALGPLVLAAIGSEGWRPFILAASIMAIAATPLAVALKSAPKLMGRPSGSDWQYALLAVGPEKAT